MTHRRDRSLRAQARAILKEVAPVLPAPTVRAGVPAPEVSLTERARALYEDSVVPVREIARLTGVSERTILKYASKHNWKPRYQWKQGKAGERHRGWQPEPAFGPVKGAGARFIKREDAGEPFSVGLKANDPAGAVRAVQACATAQASSARAEQQVAFVREMERKRKAYADATSLLCRVLSLPDPPKGGEFSGTRKRVFAGCVRLAVRHWEMALEALTESPRENPRENPGKSPAICGS